MTFRSLVTAALGALALASAPARAAIPPGIAFAGELVDESGAPFDGTVAVTLTLWDAATGGAKVFGPADLGDVVVTDGRLALSLGDDAAPLVLEAERVDALWLEVTLDGDALTPRRQLAATPYALAAGDAATVGGRDPAAFVDEAALTAKGYATTAALGAYVTTTALEAKGYVAAGALADYVTTAALDAKGYVTGTALDAKGYVTGTALDAKGYVTGTALDAKGYAKASALATVATTADYTDLVNAPDLAVYLVAPACAVGQVVARGASGWTCVDPLAPITTPGTYGATLRVADVVSRGPRLDVRAFGAKGDGATDDTAAIQAAFDAAKARSAPTTILFPSGRYLVSKTIVMDCPCEVRGERATVASTPTFAPDAVNNGVFGVRSGDFAFRDLVLENNAPVWTLHAVSADEVPMSHILIDGVVVYAHNSQALGLFIGNIEHDAVVRDSRFFADPGNQGIGLDLHTYKYVHGSGDHVVHEAEDLRVTDNTFDGWGGLGYTFGASGISLRSRFSGNTVTRCGNATTYAVNTYHFHGVFSDNIIVNNVRGWYLDGDGDEIAVTNNIIRDNTQYAAIFEEFDGTFNGNQIVNNGLAPTDGVKTDVLHAALVLGSVQQATFVGNSIHDNRGVGIYVNQGAVINSYYPFHLVIADNTIVHNGADGLWLDGNFARNISIANNIIADNGRAAASPASSIWAGVRVTVSPVGFARLHIVDNVFSNQTGLIGGGEDGAQHYGITSRTVLDEAYASTPFLWVKGNHFENLAVAIQWPYGMKTITDNTFFGDPLPAVDVPFGVATRSGNVGAYEGELGDGGDGAGWITRSYGGTIAFGGAGDTVIDHVVTPSAYGETKPQVYEVTISPMADSYLVNRIYTGRVTAINGSGRNQGGAQTALIAELRDLPSDLTQVSAVDPTNQAVGGDAGSDRALTFGSASNGFVLSLRASDHALVIRHQGNAALPAADRQGYVYFRRVQ